MGEDARTAARPWERCPTRAAGGRPTCIGCGAHDHGLHRPSV